MATTQEIVEYVSKLEGELGDPSEFSYLIPDWDPVDSKMGLHWIRSTLGEGFYVAHRINHELREVRLKSWEYGDPEPDWESLSHNA